MEIFKLIRFIYYVYHLCTKNVLFGMLWFLFKFLSFFLFSIGGGGVYLDHEFAVMLCLAVAEVCLHN